jgi:hypothetical protein
MIADRDRASRLRAAVGRGFQRLIFSAMAVTASLVILESALPVHVRSCFNAGPPAASRPICSGDTHLTPAARWKIGAFAYFGRTTGCGQ